ncbi:formate/nitrite transporter family protein [Eggerthellaceae bacterium 3-80]|nr:formate/nitrite transporter family protein [bacterium D16-34]
MSLTPQELSVLRPDELTPVEVEAKVEALSQTKATLPFAKCFVLAMLSGAFIAFGALFFCVFLGDPTLPFGVQRVVGGICFCLGLVLVLCCGAELFTGNILMICGKASKRISWSGLFRNWSIVWLGNLCGSLLAVAIIVLAQIPALNGGEVAAAMVNIAAGKIVLEPVPLFFKAVLCNIFVCLAVWIGFSARTVVDKVIGILLPISAFVACGFEHCVANMFFLPMGLIQNLQGVGVPGVITFEGLVYNIILATIGNIVGGVIVGIAYWFVYAKKDES